MVWASFEHGTRRSARGATAPKALVDALLVNMLLLTPNPARRPNIVMGANAQVALEKFARYFDVEARLVPVDESTKYVMSPERAMEYVDEVCYTPLFPLRFMC